LCLSYHASLEVGGGLAEDAEETVCVGEVVVDLFLGFLISSWLEGLYFICSNTFDTPALRPAHSSSHPTPTTIEMCYVNLDKTVFFQFSLLRVLQLCLHLCFSFIALMWGRDEGESRTPISWLGDGLTFI
jgi:hypothetical protein